MTTERWALVPVEPTPEILNAFPSNFDARIRYAEILAASPGTALLAEVLAARDALPGDPESWSKRLGRLLAALDKLGPAAEGES